MKMILASLMLAAVLARCNGISKGFAAPEFSNKYCVAEGKECPGNDLGGEIFATTLRQCFVRCNYDATCQGAFYNKETKLCQLKTKRCTDAELTNTDAGTDLYRLVKGESCPAGRPQYELPKTLYSKKFCVKLGKSCAGNDMYFKPQSIETLEDCMTKCSKLVTCTSVDFNPSKKQCSPKNYHCDDAELMDDPEMNNVMRLEGGSTQCPADRSPMNLETGGSDGDDVECSDPNSARVGSSCQCNEGFEQVEDGSCVKPKTGIEFCAKSNKVCQGHDLLAEPKKISWIEDCLDECVKFDTCLSVDLLMSPLNENIAFCYPKYYECKEDEMTDPAFRAINIQRLDDGVQCPTDRGLFCPNHPDAVGTYAKNRELSKCEFHCGQNAHLVGNETCECDAGYEYSAVRRQCRHNCPENQEPNADGDCKCKKYYWANEEGGCDYDPRTPMTNNCVAKTDGLHPFVGSCSFYLKCTKRNVQVKLCSSSQYFDPAKNQCVSQQEYNCPYNVKITRVASK